jgi:ABC-type transporter Mla MlaB component
MLKITLTDTPTEQKWILQGRLAEPWVSELWANWTNARDARQGRRCVVDLNDVTFIDQNGETVLLAMMTEDARFVARGVCTKYLLHDLRSKNKNRLRKCMKYLPAVALGFAILQTAWGINAGSYPVGDAETVAFSSISDRPQGRVGVQ